jgi:hypothetical protein
MATLLTIRRKVGIIALYLSLVAVCLFLASLVLKSTLLFWVSAYGTVIMFGLSNLLLWPSLLALTLVWLAPFFLAVYGLSHDHAFWTTSWFWVFTAACEVGGGIAFLCFPAIFRKPRFEENA